MGATRIAGALGVLVAVLFIGQLDAEAMRCRNRLVSRDDSRAKVLAICGSPIDTSNYVIYQRSGHFRHDVFALTRQSHYVVRNGLRGPEIEIPVQVDEWVYNFGRNRLMRRVVFANGRVARIHTLGYGYDVSRARSGPSNGPAGRSRAPRRYVPQAGYDAPRDYDEARPSGYGDPSARYDEAQPPAAEPPPRRVFVEPAPEYAD